MGGSDCADGGAYNYFAPSYGIPDGGAAYSYNVNGAFTYSDGQLWISALADTKNGASYSGCVKLYVNDELISINNLEVYGINYIPAGSTLIGNTTFDLSSYSDSDNISVEISTQQCVGTTCNVIPNSYSISII